MAKFGGDGTDDLINGNYLMQPSPFSWAQDQNKNNQANSQLMQEMQNRVVMQQMQEASQSRLQDKRLTQDNSIQERLEKMRQSGMDRRQQQSLDAKDDEYNIGDDGSQAVPENVYRAMPPSAQRKYEHVKTISKNGKNFMVIRPKNGAPAGGRTSQDDQYVK